MHAAAGVTSPPLSEIVGALGSSQSPGFELLLLVLKQNVIAGVSSWNCAWAVDFPVQ